MAISIWQRFARKKIVSADSIHTSKLDRCLSTFDLTALGVGATLGVGIYVLSGSVAKDVAGPSVILSFLIAGFASALSGLCYAELGARVPKAGSAYVYSYTTVGEFIAFIIGWNLVLEYTIGTASVARGYSGYLDSLLNKTMQTTFRHYLPINIPYLSPYPDLCSFILTLVLTFILCVGVKESTKFNNVFTVLNLGVVIFVTFLGLFKSNLANWSIPKNALPSDAKAGSGGFFPFGFSGTLAGAATCFYGYVGFDSIATSGEETKNPQKSIPISICLSLFIVFLSYVGVSSALTLMVPYYMQDETAPLPSAFHQVGWGFAGSVVSVGALFGLSTSLLGAMFPLPRVLYAMASDGLIFRSLANVNPTFQTPLKATVISGLFAGLMSAMLELKHLVDMMSIGTLMAYTIVSASVILLRYRDVPGLDGVSKNGDYMALGTISDDHVRTLNETDEDDEDEEELVYCTITDLNEGKTFKPKSHGQSPGILNGLFNTDKFATPTEATSKIANILTVIYTFLAAILALILDNVDFGGPNRALVTFAEVVLGIAVFGMTLCLLLLSLQPKTSQTLAFKVPLVPLLPGLSIFINIYLMLKLSMETWVRFFVWMVIGFVIYFGYGLRNSSEEYRMKGKRAPGEETGLRARD